MELQLTVNDNFFAELTQRLWKNSSDVVRELVQNAYDADASKVIVTFLPNGLTVEDDGGMDPARLRSFLQVGGTHEEVEFTARGRRVVGKYRVGRLSALGAFSRMLVRTRLDDYHVSFEFSVEDLHRLSQGNGQHRRQRESPAQAQRHGDLARRADGRDQVRRGHDGARAAADPAHARVRGLRQACQRIRGVEPRGRRARPSQGHPGHQARGQHRWTPGDNRPCDDRCRQRLAPLRGGAGGLA